MSQASSVVGRQVSDDVVPEELQALRDGLRMQPGAVRAALGPLVEEVVESARFRQRVLTVARDALEQYRLELAMARFDLEVTRRELCEGSR